MFDGGFIFRREDFEERFLEDFDKFWLWLRGLRYGIDFDCGCCFSSVLLVLWLFNDDVECGLMWWLFFVDLICNCSCCFCFFNMICFCFFCSCVIFFIIFFCLLVIWDMLYCFCFFRFLIFLVCFWLWYMFDVYRFLIVECDWIRNDL